jgi:SAM-dependent methyltransferase
MAGSSPARDRPQSQSQSLPPREGYGKTSRPGCAIDHSTMAPPVTPPAPRCEELASCPVCGCPSYHDRILSRDLLHSVPGTFRYVECARCRTAYQNPRVLEEDLPLCYPGSYYAHASEGAWAPNPAPTGSLRDRVRRAIRRAADGVPDETVTPSFALLGGLLGRHPGLRRRARLGLVDGLALPSDERGRCLEVGPGQGLDLLRLRLLGWDARGLEVDPIAAECARNTSGSEVRVGTLASTDYPAEYFDLVYMSHVFEHLPDPSGSLRRCLELLKPGGRLVLLYPNPGALTAQCYGSLSPIWDPPRHLVLPPIPAILPLVGRSGFVDARARTLAAQAALNAEAARRRRGLTWNCMVPGRPGLPDRAFALAESLVSRLGRPVGEEVLVHARKPHCMARSERGRVDAQRTGADRDGDGSAAGCGVVST